MQRHSVRIDYDTRSQAVTVEADGVVVQQQVQNRLGVPLEPWDLHVGAVLDLLGQKVTLASCNLAVRLTPGGICGPVNSELSMPNRIRLSKFRFTILYNGHLTLRWNSNNRRTNENGNLA